jgi:hypothetical protein
MSENLEVGTIEWFTSVFFAINPVNASNGASLNSAYYYASKAIGDTLPGGVILTWEELLKRYTDYYNYKLPLQNDKYTRKQDIIQTIEDYCYEKMYQSDYSKIQERPADKYLFGI